MAKIFLLSTATTSILILSTRLLLFSTFAMAAADGMALSSANALPTSCISNKKICIIGGGPTSLFLAHLLLEQDATVKINILERSPERGTVDTNSFGFGIGPRHQRCLGDDLWNRLAARSAPIDTAPLRIIGRSVLCQELRAALKDEMNNKDELSLSSSSRCNVMFDTSCSHVDLDRQIVSTDGGKEIQYDLLIGADGVHSVVRQLLVGQGIIQEERYVRPALWKSLQLPAQSPPTSLSPGAFKPLSHPHFHGAVFPRYPDGYTALIFWKDMTRRNPTKINTAQDLKISLTAALQPKANRWQLVRRFLFSRKLVDETKGEIVVRFDENEVSRFISASPRREYYIKLNKYHDDIHKNVALVGDAAHSMYSFLGQGAACGFQSAKILARCLQEEPLDIFKALQAYSLQAVPEGHAATELNLVSHSVFGRVWAKLMAFPLILLGALRGKLLIKRLHQDVSYSTIWRENRALVLVSRFFWKKERIPFTVTKSKTE